MTAFLTYCSLLPSCWRAAPFRRAGRLGKVVKGSGVRGVTETVT